VTATDPVTWIVVPLFLAGMALGASWMPARRATRVDPREALTEE
jgi:ABC-type lipoprotein release transport system permease subunit